jgi:hypothetical protein
VWHRRVRPPEQIVRASITRAPQAASTPNTSTVAISGCCGSCCRICSGLQAMVYPLSWCALAGVGKGGMIAWSCDLVRLPDASACDDDEVAVVPRELFGSELLGGYTQKRR